MYKRITDTHREALTAALGAPLDLCPLQPEVLSKEELEDYRRVKVRYQVQVGEFVPAYVLIPSHVSKPTSAVVCHHRYHADWQLGKSEVVGLVGDPDEAIGVELVKQGYVVLAPDAIFYEDRRPDGMTQEHYFRELTVRLLKGETLLKKAIWDISRGIDYLEMLPEADPDSIGIVGHGYGAWMALWVAAMDERIVAGAGHGGWTSLREQVRLKLPIQAELVVPRLLQVADVDRILAQVAPRPFLISTMRNDPTSLDPEIIYTKASEVYEAFEVNNPLSFYHHEPDPQGQLFPTEARQKLYDWLGEWLKPSA